MKKTLLLWKILDAEHDNFTNLQTEKFFYWSEDSKLTSVKVDDYLIIIDRKSFTFLFVTYLGSEGLTIEVDRTKNQVNVKDETENITLTAVEGLWENFIKFKILQNLKIESQEWVDDFKFLSTNGILTLFKYVPNKNNSANTFVPPKTVLEGSILKKLLELHLNEEAKNALEFAAQYIDTINIISNSNEKPLVDRPNEKKLEKEAISPKEIINHVHKYITNLGFQYQFEEIANFYLALRAKPFVILAGISGTGKTQLPRKFAASLGFSKEQVIQLPVRPDWTDSSDLLGYTSLDGNFIPKDLTIAIQKATANPDKPYFFILDEMNLARVEHYFSDFLSVIETRERFGKEIKTDPILREEVLKAAKNKNDFTEMGWPQNLYLIGTVNMDETTHAFSKKVLDRANSIEMNEVDLNWITSNGKSIEKLNNIPNEIFKTVYLNSAELKETNKKSISEEMLLLQEVNTILQKADLHFAYRVRDEIAFYLIINKENTLKESRTAFDFQLVQKVLPRIHGSSERVQTVLVELLNLLEGKDFRSSSFEFSMLSGKIDTDNLKYKRTSKKIIFMLKRYDDDRFTSFWL
ncbi:MAG TPA: AAA family ATPase [Chitinophagaceae bacterium]|nr:AAA family ATPase [Chitinophagaceae bacterium]